MQVFDPGGFVHLHVHSHYSTLDGSIRVKDLCRRAVALGMPALALTDHGNLFGALDFQEQAHAAGLKPIFGCEFYIAPSGMAHREAREKPYHLLILAENRTGYRNLCRLASIAYIEGFYSKPRIDKEVLAENSAGLVFGSGCLAGELNFWLRRGDRERARQAAGEYLEIAGKGNFYIEMMDHGMAEQRELNPQLVALAREMDIPLLATNDIHFLNRDDKEAHEILLCIGTGSKMSDPNRFNFSSDQFYLKSADEMKALFRELPDALANTVLLAERCTVEIETTDTAPVDQKYKIPAFPVPDGKGEEEYLRELCEEGLARRYPEVTEAIRERFEMELSVILRMGFPAYFLIVWDLVHYARLHGIPVGPGRGSAAGSIVSYALGITDVDPLAFDLFFERFLNPGRISMPDIDIDFCVARRGQIIEYIRKRYGTAQVSQIITFSYLKAKAVIKDVARVLEIDFAESNRISALIPQGPDVTLEKAFNENPELRELRASSEVHERLFRNAFKLEGVIRHSGVHAAGVVISSRPLVEYIPLYKDNKTDTVVSQFDGPHLEKVGLLKMDILGLKNLTTMEECRKLVHDHRHIELDFDRLPENEEADRNTYRLLQEGRSLGVFQLESDGMQNLLRNMKPERFSEIIALIALYRPGPLNLGMHNDFVDIKFGRKPLEYAFPAVEPILRDTNGIIVYQEQVMLISQVVGGFSMEEADNLRKAMGKKKKDIVDRMQKRFLDGAKARNFDQAKAADLYNRMAQFAEYGFNKSHSTAYAVLSYRTAYLKANYPLEYMAALLTGDKDDSDKIAKYVKEARAMGIEVLPPDVNYSEMNFSVERQGIRYGLSAIKGVGEAAAEAILRAREQCNFFHDLDAFCRHVNLHAINRRVVEVLISCGAFASLGRRRSTLFAALERSIQLAQHHQQDQAVGQANFFDILEEATPAPLEAPVEGPEWPEARLFAQERELLGTYLSGHPLARYQATIRQSGALSSTALLRQTNPPAQARLAGMLVSILRKRSRNGNEFLIVTLEDLDGRIELLFYSEAAEAARDLLIEGNVVLVQADVRRQPGRDKVSLYGQKVFSLEELRIQNLHIYLRDDAISDDILFQLREELIDSKHRGNSPVFFHMKRGRREVTIRANAGISVKPSPALLDSLRHLPAVSEILLR